MIDDKMEVGMDVERLLDQFLIDFGTVLGGKLAPSWHPNPKKRLPKRCQKMSGKKLMQVSAEEKREMGSGPLKTFKNNPGNPWKLQSKKCDALQLALWRIIGFNKLHSFLKYKKYNRIILFS